MKNLNQEFIKSVEQNYPVSKDKILEAYKFAAKAHEGITRKSGEPYIIHPVAVAQILIDNDMDYPTIIAGLLHDVVEDTSISIDEVKKTYGQTVAKLVEGVTKIDEITLESKKLTESDSIKKLLLAMAEDIRIIFIKLADRLHNMRTVEFLNREKQLKMSKETQELFIPIAERLGIRKLRSELQALVFKCMLPDEYAKTKNELDNKLAENQKALASLEHEMKIILRHNRVQGEIVALPGNYYSIYKRINGQGTDKLYALKFFKIIVATELDCYKVLGLLHKNYTPVPKQIVDYIATPKANGYQSLHSTLMSKGSDITFSIMIRTPQMDKNCEFGISSLWRDKDNDKKYEDKFERHNELKKIILGEDEASSTDEFISAIKTDLNSTITWVFTPEHKAIRISAKNPTAIDFAFAVHSDIGNSAVSAIINGNEMPLSTELKTGDEVKICVSKTKNPSRTWLAFAKTAYARRKIREFLKKKTNTKASQKGKEILETKLAENNLSGADILSNFADIQRYFSIINLVDVYASAVFDEELISKIIEFLKGKKERLKELKNSPVVIEKSASVSEIDFAKCCCPVVGEKIIGVLSKNGVVVHCKTCKNLEEISKHNLVDVKWRANANKCLETNLTIVIKDGVGILADIFDEFASSGVDISKVVAKRAKKNEAEINVGFKIKDIDALNNLIKNLKNLKVVKNVLR